MEELHAYTSRTWIVLVIFFVFGPLFGCVDESQQTAEGGIEGTGKTIGPISGFGSVFVNGIRLDTSNTDFTIEGSSGAQDQLFQGMVITADTDSNAADSANTINLNFNVIGAVDYVSYFSNGTLISLSVAGQAIITDALTVFKNIAKNDIQRDDILAISGFRKANRSIKATYLEKIDADNLLIPDGTVISGKIHSINSLTSTFKIGTQLIDFSSTQLTTLVTNSFINGPIVRVKGEETGDRLIAASIEIQPNILSENSIGQVSVTGIVNSIAGFPDFTVNDIPMTLAPDTVFQNGSRSNFRPDLFVLVRGNRIEEGVLAANDIIFLDTPNTGIEAVVEQVDSTSGTVELAGLTVTVNGFTLLLDNTSGPNIANFSLNDVGIGDRLLISGIEVVEQGQTTILASRLERLSLGSMGDQVIIEGSTGSSTSEPIFSIAGLPIDTSGLVDCTIVALSSLSSCPGFFKSETIPITSSEFFQIIKPGSRLRVTGTPSTGFIAATRIEMIRFSNFLLLNRSGYAFGGANDLIATWDGTVRLSTTDSTANMMIKNTGRTKIFGYELIANTAVVFGSGTYTFETCPNDGSTRCTFPQPLTLTVGPGQLGLHALFDWGQRDSTTPCGVANCNIDVAVVWEFNGRFPTDQSSFSPDLYPDTIWDLVSVDGDGDGIPGIAMVDGALMGLSLNFNLNVSFEPEF